MLVVKFGGSQKLHVYFQLCRGQHLDPYTVQGWTVNKMEYHSALKKKEIMKWAMAWMNFKDIIKWNKPATEIQCCMITLIWGIDNSQICRIK